MGARDIVGLLKDTFTEWSEDKASRLGAAVAYYTVFSLAPLLVVVIAVVGLVFGEKAVRGEIAGQIQGLVGPDGAQMIQAMIANASKPATGIIATVIGIVTLLLGATGLFGELQDALNTIWEIAPKPRGILETIRERVVSFGMVLGIAFLLLVALVISAAVSALGQFLGGVLPVPEVVLQVIDLVISFGIVTLLFAMMYKVLPDAEIAWHDVWIGAAVTSILFAIGKLGIGLYLGHSGTTSTYGAAGSLVVVLLWVYYSAQILFFGAEFTQIYANRYGSHVKPAPDATAAADQMQAKDLRPDTEHTSTPEDKRRAAGVGDRNAPSRGLVAATARPAARDARSTQRTAGGVRRGESWLVFAAGVIAVAGLSALRAVRGRGPGIRGVGIG
jgi:membrane protein